ncbi:hypothetical protein HHI36_000840 [Cryptolaemus montrouzieri]|uniref:Apolipoprotein D n=1 Tax=Cryptolaemus montrouzieri TaxID=559131 RepID=A0ABD2P6I9_9CUCU
MFQLLLTFLFCVYGIYGQVPVVGKCPTISSVQQNFDLNRYLGKWYEAEKYFMIFEAGGKCNSANYSLNENGTVKVLNEEIDILGKQSSIVGVARPAGAADEAKFLVSFPSYPVQTGEAPYWVLETDYDNYAVVWSCTELPIISTRFAWILTRERNPSTDVVQKAYAVFDRLNLDKTQLQKTDQSNCPSD